MTQQTQNQHLTSLDSLPDISKEDQTRAWVWFYHHLGTVALTPNGIHSLTETISANLGEPADPRLVAHAAVEQARQHSPE